jgi:hypothetical protein
MWHFELIKFINSNLNRFQIIYLNGLPKLSFTMFPLLSKRETIFDLFSLMNSFSLFALVRYQFAEN